MREVDRMFNPAPSEIPIGGVYLPPALVVILAALALAWITAKILNRARLARFFWNPPLAFLAMWALLSALIGLFVLAV